MTEQHASAAEYARNILDVGVPAAASKATYVAAGVTVGGGLSTNEVVAIGGFLLGVLTFSVNWYYKHKLTTVEIRVRLEAAERERAEHNARMGLYEG